ncbi:hypothetical protein E4N62_31380 [Streptomyces sp. MNU76]|uniref:hypothetical protein n=1 Tax=Streptomyces sp. MNU76 TaxID=2560026 RepID=UPI001E30F1B5|nr:hypothetical protein [Streptomyces sp. MNU76]MCC9709359.1 hypothetical protein [Streptomyces sp. MNU76]
MRALTVMREWSPRRKVALAVALQVVWLGVMLVALLSWDLPLTAPVAIALWVGPAAGGILGIWMGSKSSPE